MLEKDCVIMRRYFNCFQNEKVYSLSQISGLVGGAINGMIFAAAVDIAGIG